MITQGPWKSKQRVSRRFTFFLCFFLGLILAFTTIFAIVHEIGHVLAAGDTLTVKIIDWSHVRYTGKATLGFLLAGWACQFWSWYLLWAVNQWFSWRQRCGLFDVVAGFSWGYVHGTAIQALRSQDFLDIQLKLGYALSETRLAWLVATIPFLIIGWLLVKNCLKEMQ